MYMNLNFVHVLKHRKISFSILHPCNVSCAGMACKAVVGFIYQPDLFNNNITTWLNTQLNQLNRNRE